jgi:hypothetical protein
MSERIVVIGSGFVKLGWRSRSGRSVLAESDRGEEKNTGQTGKPMRRNH